jgi:hypothetical protein
VKASRQDGLPASKLACRLACRQTIQQESNPASKPAGWQAGKTAGMTACQLAVWNGFSGWFFQVAPQFLRHDKRRWA